jgi:bifunctional UDP-N-acetylglucosamine pyrophosphorylase/glucosamine-1-phosphate N-acetyltransferase
MGDNLSAIILAAVDDSAMKSAKPTVLHTVCGRSILDYVLLAAAQVSDTPPVVLAIQDDGCIREHLGENCQIKGAFRYIYQEDGQSEAEGLIQALDCIEDTSGYTFVISGNIPLLQASTLQDMLHFAEENHLDAVEAGGLSVTPAACFQKKALLEAVSAIGSQGLGKRYFPADIFRTLKAGGKQAGTYGIHDSSEFLEVKDRIRLAEAEALMRRRINESHMRSGVTIFDPSATYIGADVRIGQDTILYPGNVLEGTTTIGQDCVLYPNNRLQDAEIGCRVMLQSSVILDSSIGSGTTVGPFAYIRPGSRIGSHVRIGDFVEIKNSSIGEHTKVSHLTYIGDAELGKEINVGCGVVSVNYDGKNKHKTVIGDHAFIGCNVNLVAPVEVEDHAYIAAGSTITEKVPARALAIARARQVNKEGWVDKREQKKTEEKK